MDIYDAFRESEERREERAKAQAFDKSVEEIQHKITQLENYVKKVNLPPITLIKIEENKEKLEDVLFMMNELYEENK